MDKATFASYRKFYNNQLLNDCIPFWLNSDLLDKENGGYITSVDREGKAYNTDKSGWFQGRCLWTFSHLSNLYGKRPEWEEAAQLGKDFLDKYIADTDGRMYFTLTKEGLPLRKRRYFFTESFYVLSMAEYSIMTGDKDALKKAEDCFEMMLSIFRDGSTDPFKITPKSYASTREERAVSYPMVLISSAQTLRRADPEKAEYYTKVAQEMADIIINIHYKPDMNCVLETVGPNGEFIDNPAGRTINPGHSMENSWFLMNQAIYTGDKELLANALKILDCSLEWGWDNEFGGFIYFTDVSGRPCEQLEHDMKLWWVHNEACIATLLAYSLTKDVKYWKWFEKIHFYAFGHFADKEYGEWYGYLHKDGTVSHRQKGSMWKGPFHHPRFLMCCEYIFSCLEEDKPVVTLL